MESPLEQNLGRPSQRRSNLHWHHIVPRHEGGSDEPSNLIQLTVEEHAEAHKLLWEQNGKLEDKFAWLMLAGLKTEGEVARKELQRRWYQENPVAPRSEESRRKQSETMKRHPYRGGGRPKGYKLSADAKKRIGDKNRGRKNPGVAERNRERIWTTEQRERHSRAQKERRARGKIGIVGTATF